MSNTPPLNGATPGARHQDIDDAEKGLYDGSSSVLASPGLAHLNEKALVSIDSFPSPLSPISPIHHGITPSASVPVLSLSGTQLDKTPEPPAQPPVAPTPANKALAPAKPKPKKVSAWIRFRLWFNTYKQFFTFCVLLNLTGMIMAGLGRFPYATNHLGALVLGNLLFAVLMRNELLLRVLYMIAIYGLRSVS
jgi:hypothetical protein